MKSFKELNPSKLTPMMRHWYDVKKKYPNQLVAYRMGDFFEFFYDDAIRISKLLGITLTRRTFGGKDSYPLAGIPHHSGNYLKNLVNLGETVVIVEQLEDPADARGRIVKRGVVRIFSPGTIIESDMLKTNENNYISSIVKGKKGFGIAFADLSTGEFSTTQFESKEGIAEEDLLAIFSRYSPVELIIPSNLYQDEEFIIKVKDISNCIVKEFQDYVFEFDNSYSIITKHFNLSNLEPFDLEDLQMAIQASGGLLAFLKETQRDVIPNIFQIKAIKEKDVLNLDYSTQRNLELSRNIRDRGKDATLFSIFNHTQTPMGGRLLAKIIVEPLTNREQINQRLDIVQKFKDDVFLRSDLRDKLEKMGDLERIINKVNYSRSTNARDLLNLKNSLELIPEIIALLKKGKSPELESFLKNIKDFSKIRDLVEVSIAEHPPTTIKEGGIIKEGYNETVDEYRNIINNGKNWMLKFEKSLKRRFAMQTGIKVSHNNILGYYIEITNATRSKIRNFPEEFISRQSIKNAVRYKCNELNEWEEKILTAEEKINDLEYQLFSEIRENVVKQTIDIKNASESIAMIDALCTFAEIAEKNDYCRPIIRDDDKIVIKGGRHPIVEKINYSEPFISNDCYMDTENEQILIITGPNMAGKCVQKDTYIFSEKGILPIKWFKPKDIAIESFKDFNIKLIGLGGIVETSHFYSDGLKPSIIIKSRLGYYIEGSVNHPILVKNPSGKEVWKKLSEVSINDYLIINRKNDLWGNKTTIQYNPPKYETGTPVYPYGGIKYNLPTQIDEDLAYLIGLLIGDGTLTYKRSFSFTSKDTFLKNEFYRIIKKLFSYNAKSKKEDKSEHFVSSLYIRDFLYYLGLDYVVAHEKVIPECLLRAPKKIIIALLQGLFDTDGTADNKYGNVSYSTTSITLATQIHTILLNFGIISSLKPKKTSGRVIYNIYLYGEDTIKFYQEIGFRLPRKSERKNLLSKTRMTNIDSIPYLENLLKIIQNRIVDNSDIIPHNDKLKYNKKIGGIFYSYIPQNRNISFHKLKELIDYCQKYSIKCDRLEELYQNNFFYEKIVTIEKSKAELYDFTIPKTHSFIGNGFINHNSTYLRQVALICLIAQMGSFVPAKSAELGIIDRIFTRIGASDDLARRLSTFMIEMNETAKILNYATPKSLIIIDELGRGTSSSDGGAIAIATLEKLHSMKIKTLFSTHFHQLTEIKLPRVKNYHLDIKEDKEGNITFIRKVQEGSTDKSYGIHIARLAGIPEDTIERAFEVLEQIDVNDKFREAIKNGNNKRKLLPKPRKKEVKKPLKTVQTSFFKPIIKVDDDLKENYRKLIDLVKGVDINNITPIKAMEKLIEIKKKLEDV